MGGLIQKLAALLQNGLVLPGNMVQKDQRNMLKVLKMNWIKGLFKLNYIKLDIGVIMQKIFQRTCNQWVVFFD